ncbi:hypothetical protein JYG23_10330 [Sedimentibacter sp. zth1]|uniref:hypothetical protein n=1 Tax=Sedimentibacter sp. zth1 TaxID=2816908 RepID=UPI001A93468C|nr:hypothetical protein [Sedimentibacter sp. zth1]QSX05083.1 hypothetical protein JYG23_10330 [Sedimentibacter sp. zth1]
MKNKNLLYISFVGIIIALSAIMFLLNDTKDNLFWTTYIFLIVSILGVFFSCVIVTFKHKSKNIASNLVLITISIIYFVLNVLISILCINVLKCTFKVYISLSIITFTIFIILWIVGYCSSNYINSQD